MYTKKDFKVGQSLFFRDQYEHVGEIHEIKIKKVGNKLLHTYCGEKIDVKTLELRSDYRYLKYFLSKEAILESDQAQKSWIEIQDIIQMQSFWALTPQQIRDLNSAVKKILDR